MANRRMSAEEKKWQAEMDARTLKEAAELQGNRERMKAVREHIKREQEAMKKILGPTTRRKTTARKR